MRSVVTTKDRKGFLGDPSPFPALNSASVMKWNTDKHRLQELAKRGMPTIATTARPSKSFGRNQVHTRFPAMGDFVVKPAISSGGAAPAAHVQRTRSPARGHHRRHAPPRRGRSVLVQHYHEEVDRSGEVSLIYLNGLPSYKVEKEPLTIPARRRRHRGLRGDRALVDATEQEWRWGERIRHSPPLPPSRAKAGATASALQPRQYIVHGGPSDEEEFYVMEISLIDGSLYLSADEDNLSKFADAIAVRASW